MKRKHETADINAARAAAKAKRQRLADQRALAGPVLASSTTRQAIRTGGWANPAAGGELKFIDVTAANSTLAFGSSAFAAGILLNGIQQGSDANTRIGRKITLKSSWSAGRLTLAQPQLAAVLFAG